MTKNLKLTLATLFIMQVLISTGFELAHDEAYYWLYSRNLDWGFFDHPPLVGVIIKLFSFLPHTELAVRFGFIILQFASLIILLNLTTNYWVSILLFFSLPLASLSGLLALPDAPLLFMTACYCYQLKRYLAEDSFKNSSLLGLIIALLFYAKYHGVLLVFFSIVALPKLLFRKSFYIVAMVALVVFFPHVLWQYQHDFPTIKYHFFERPRASFSVVRVVEFIVSQVLLSGVLVGPIVWWTLLRKKTPDNFESAMKFICIGTILFFLVSSFGKRVEANWTIFLTIPFIYVSTSSQIWDNKLAKGLLIVSFAIVMFTRVIFIFSPELVEINRIREIHGWKQWARDVDAQCGGQPILANTYQIASKLAYYLQKNVGSINYHSRKNQFDYWQFEKDIPTKEVCYITDKFEFPGIIFHTPTGKILKIVKNQSMESLLKLKYRKIGK